MPQNYTYVTNLRNAAYITRRGRSRGGAGRAVWEFSERKELGNCLMMRISTVIFQFCLIVYQPEPVHFDDTLVASFANVMFELESGVPVGVCGCACLYVT